MMINPSQLFFFTSVIQPSPSSRQHARDCRVPRCRPDHQPLLCDGGHKPQLRLLSLETTVRLPIRQKKKHCVAWVPGHVVDLYE